MPCAGPSSTTAPCPCRLCGAAAEPTCVQRVLGRHDVRYYRCPACDLMQTEPPYWLDEAYARTGPSLDTRQGI